MCSRCKGEGEVEGCPSCGLVMFEDNIPVKAELPQYWEREIMILNLIDLSIFQKLFIALNDKYRFLDTMDILEDLIPILDRCSKLNESEIELISIDDATTEAANQMREKAAQFYALAERLVSDYIEFSSSELKELIEVSESFALQVAILYYGTGGYSEIIHELLSDGVISNDHSVELLDKLVTKKSDVEIEVVLILRLFEKYKPYLAEYVLTEEQLGTIENSLPEGINFALLNQDTVRNILGE